MPHPDTIAWDDWLLLGSQLLSLVFLVVYVIKTWQMASSTRTAAEATQKAVEHDIDTRLESLAPRVVVYLDASERLSAQIIIHNVGAGTAEDFSMEFEPPLQTTLPHESDGFFQTVQPMLPPGYRQAQTFDTFPTYLKSDLPKQYRVTAKYRGAENERQYTVRYSLDMEAQQHRLVQQSPLSDIREELKDLRTVVEKGFRGVEDPFGAIRRLQALSPAPPQQICEAVSNLVGTWELMKVIESEPHSTYPYMSLVELLQSECLRASRLAAAEQLTEVQDQALANCAVAIFSLEAVTLGGDWTGERDDAIGSLASAFAVNP